MLLVARSEIVLWTPVMSPLPEADQMILESRVKLASLLSYTGVRMDDFATMVRSEVLELETLALAVPSKAVKIHRLLQRWRRLYSSLWDTAA